MYIADDKISFSLQGLRWIQKSDRAGFTQQDPQFSITIQYKGSTTHARYKTREERDEIYNLAVKHLTRNDDRYTTSTLKEERITVEEK